LVIQCLSGEHISRIGEIEASALERRCALCRIEGDVNYCSYKYLVRKNAEDARCIASAINVLFLFFTNFNLKFISALSPSRGALHEAS
jgi:hypothetical protein